MPLVSKPTTTTTTKQPHGGLAMVLTVLLLCTFCCPKKVASFRAVSPPLVPLTAARRSLPQTGTARPNHQDVSSASASSASLWVLHSTMLPKQDGLSLQDYPDKDNNSNNHCLKLDAQGRLRLCRDPDRVVLQGLDPKVWSATRPTTWGDNSDNNHNNDDSTTTSRNNALFLHTTHPQSMPEHQTSLGNLVACQRLLACARQNRYWMGPKTGTSAKDIPFDTQFLLLEMEPNHQQQPHQQPQQQYALLLPLVDNGFRATLQHSSDPSLSSSLSVVCAAESGDATVTSRGMRALYVAVGDDPFQLVKQGLADVAQATGTFDVLDRKQLPPSVNDFGWCTWDAFYSRVTPQGIVDGVQALTDAGVPPRHVILDDGWQQVNPMPNAWMQEVDNKNDNNKNNQNDNNIVQPRLDTILFDAMAKPIIKVISTYYDKVVRTAPHGSLFNRVWATLAKSVLKDGLWNFFDSETDFNRQLDGFQANHKFESNEPGQERTLKQLVSELKQRHGIKSVYCWHALHGYWRGVSEELGKRVGIKVINTFPKPPLSLMKLEPHAAWDPVTLWGVGVMTTEQDLEKFYTHLHTPLVEAGVDGVKVDVQSGVSSAGDGVGGGPHISKLYMKAMESSVAKRFPSGNGAVNCINCMCHSTENIYRHKLTSVARASEDFFPDKPESHTAHLVNVAYNSLFLGEICLPDWDMFHSLHESAALHAAARAIGGCPMYVSDKPGQHDTQLLRKLVLPDGSILRAKQPGRPTRDCLFADVTADKKTALKIWNVNSGGGVVGAFNVQGVAWNFETHENEVLNSAPSPVVTEVKPGDIEPYRNHDGPFIGWRHRSGTLEFLEDAGTAMKANLEHREWEIFTIVPIEITDDIMWAPIGLPDMLNSGGSLTSTGSVTKDSKKGSKRVGLTSRGPGRFVAFTNRSPSNVLLEGNDGFPSSSLEYKYDAETGELSFLLPDESPAGQPHHMTVEWPH